jgi:hypothetical protein
MARTKAEKEKIEAVSNELMRLTGEFCDKYLNEEYKHLCEKLILKMKRKRNVPFMSGRASTWAAGIIYALGQINFLFDGEFEPYVERGEIPRHFGVAQSTVGQKAKAIRDMFRLDSWDAEFSTQEMRDTDPYRDMVILNGFIVPISMLPPDLQEQFRREQGE